MKDINVRAIIVKDFERILLEKENKKTYYNFPGLYTKEKDIKESLKKYLVNEKNVDVDIMHEAYKIENGEQIQHFFLCKYIARGEELEQVNVDNIENVNVIPKKIKEKILKDLEESTIINIGDV